MSGFSQLQKPAFMGFLKKQRGRGFGLDSVDGAGQEYSAVQFASRMRGSRINAIQFRGRLKTKRHANQGSRSNSVRLPCHPTPLYASSVRTRIRFPFSLEPSHIRIFDSSSISCQYFVRGIAMRPFENKNIIMIHHGAARAITRRSRRKSKRSTLRIR